MQLSLCLGQREWFDVVGLVIAYWMSDNECTERRRHRAEEPDESHHVS
jgi:hypothetical protein